jgi:hypothetical protein
MKFRRKENSAYQAKAINHSVMPFVIGASRSGTTLLRMMLDSHPQMAIPPETGFLLAGPKLKAKGDQLRKDFAHAIMNFPEEMPAWPDFSISAEDLEYALSEIIPFNLSEGYRAFYRLYANRFGKNRWGDKTPMYCLHMDTIRSILPETKFIHIIRDGRDTALSLRNQWFSPGPDIEALAAQWQRRVQAARFAGLGHPDYLEIRFEELIANTRETLQKICVFIDLDFNEEMLDYPSRAPRRIDEHQGRNDHEGKVLISKSDRFKQQWRSTQPPDPACISAWKSGLTPDEQERFKRVAGDLLKSLGYET